MTTNRETFKMEFCDGAQRSSENLPGNSKADLNAGGGGKSERAGTSRNHWEAALWTFAIVGWGVVAYLYRLHPSLP